MLLLCCPVQCEVTDGGEWMEGGRGAELMDGETSFPFIVFHREQQQMDRGRGAVGRVDWRKSGGYILWAT